MRRESLGTRVDASAPLARPSPIVLVAGSLCWFTALNISASIAAPFSNVGSLVKKYIDVVFDDGPGPETGRFVECEDPAGKSINAGTWIKREDGYWVLRIERFTLDDIKALIASIPETNAQLVSDEALYIQRVMRVVKSGIIAKLDQEYAA